MRENKLKKSHILPNFIHDNLFVKKKYTNRFVLQECGDFT